MKILVVGNGGREHALLWRMASDRPDAGFLITRGTPGTEALAESIDVSPTDIPAVVEAAAEHQVDLTVVGPEVPLADGLVDRLMERGLAAFGPTAAAARIETSKAFAKELMRKCECRPRGLRDQGGWAGRGQRIDSLPLEAGSR